MPADFPPHDCTPYSHVSVRRARLGFVHRSRPVPNPDDSRLFPSLVQVLYKRKEMESGRVMAKQVKKVLGCIQPHLYEVEPSNHPPGPTLSPVAQSLFARSKKALRVAGGRGLGMASVSVRSVGRP
jgi:hypothetical protein